MIMVAAFLLTSPAFLDGMGIPQRYTADGRDVSVPLEWSGTPEGTVSLALVCEDPDAPSGTWTHWVVWNIPADAGGLPEGIDRTVLLSDGTAQGVNSWGDTGWGGPSPPSGTHRYVFTLYALDVQLEIESGSTAADLCGAARGHVLGTATLTGVYSRSR